MLRKLMNDEVCQQFTYFGTSTKKIFSLTETNSVLKDAVRE
ncbi:unnamed protein product, partial [Allacma fusca]